MMDMYAELASSFWRIHTSERFSNGAIALYFFLIHSSYSLNWKFLISHGLDYLAAQLKISKNTIKDGRAQLQSAGLVIFDNSLKGRSNSTVYELVHVRRLKQEQSDRFAEEVQPKQSVKQGRSDRFTGNTSLKQSVKQGQIDGFDQNSQKKPVEFDPTLDGLNKDTTKDKDSKTHISVPSDSSPEKKQYAPHVNMTPAEYNSLVQEYGPELTKKFVNKLSNSKGSKGYKYASDYYAIRDWVIDAVKDHEQRKQHKSHTRPVEQSYDDVAADRQKLSAKYRSSAGRESESQPE